MIEKRVRQSTSGTSFDEQTIFFYVKQIFPDAINRGKYSFVENENIELDIYIPSLHLAIEYDGAHWHKNKSEIDNYKNFVLSKAGAYLIRIRECGLDDLENNYGETIFRTTSLYDKGWRLHDVVNKVFEIIKRYIDQNELNVSLEIVELLDKFHLDATKLIEDRPNIYAQYHTVAQENSIANTCLMKYWDYEKNGNLRPENVNIKSGICVMLTCSKGKSICVHPSSYKLSNELEASKFEQCMLNYCPAIVGDIVGYTECRENCDIYYDVLKNSKYITKHPEHRAITQLEYLYSLRKDKNTQYSQSPCTKILIESPYSLYKKEKEKIFKRLEKEKNTITSRAILNCFLFIEYTDRFELLNHIADIGASSPTLIEKTKEVLQGKVTAKSKDSNARRSCGLICIPETVSPSIALNSIKLFGITRFSFQSLKCFDDCIFMDEFCDVIRNENNGSSWGHEYYFLLETIKKEYKTLSAYFCNKLYHLLECLNKVNHYYGFEDCNELLKTRFE